MDERAREARAADQRESIAERREQIRKFTRAAVEGERQADYWEWSLEFNEYQLRAHLEIKGNVAKMRDATADIRRNVAAIADRLVSEQAELDKLTRPTLLERIRQLF